MDYNIVKSVIRSELREHKEQEIVLVNFSHGDGEGELSMLQAQEMVPMLLQEHICRRCEITLKVDSRQYMYIEFRIQR